MKMLDVRMIGNNVTNFGIVKTYYENFYILTLFIIYFCKNINNIHIRTHNCM